MRTNWQSCIIAFLMAVSLWFMVAGREPLEAWTTAQVVLSAMPEDMVIMDGMEPSIEVRVRAPKALLRSLGDQPIVYPLDLSSLHVGGNTIPVVPDEIRIPGAFEVTEVRPTQLQLIADKVVERQLPVVAKGELPQDFVATVEYIEPESVTVRGPKSVLDGMKEAPATLVLPEEFSGTEAATGPVDEVHTLQVALALPDGLEASVTELMARVRLQLQTRTISVYRDVMAAAVESMDVTIRPERVRLYLQMPASERLNKERGKDVRAEIVLPDSLLQTVRAAGAAEKNAAAESMQAGSTSSGNNSSIKDVSGTKSSGKAALRKRLNLPYRVNLPEGVWLQRTEPEQVQVTITPR